MTEPQANTSVGAPTDRPSNCSGAMYAGVPMMPLVTVSGAWVSRAIPKSITRAPSGPSRTLDGLKSRWTMPASWMAVSAVAVATASRWRAAVPSRGPACCSDGPSTYSVTTYGRGPSSDASRTCAMQNGSTRRAAAISFMKRSRTRGSAASSSRSSFTATCAPSAAAPR